MNKYEQYADAIRELKNNEFYINFIKPYLIEANSEEEMEANACAVYTTLCLMKKHEEPEEQRSKRSSSSLLEQHRA